MPPSATGGIVSSLPALYPLVILLPTFLFSGCLLLNSCSVDVTTFFYVFELSQVVIGSDRCIHNPTVINTPDTSQIWTLPCYRWDELTRRRRHY